MSSHFPQFALANYKQQTQQIRYGFLRQHCSSYLRSNFPPTKTMAPVVTTATASSSRMLARLMPPRTRMMAPVGTTVTVLSLERSLTLSTFQTVTRS